MPFSAAHPSLRRALTARGFVAPTPVQAHILAAEVGDRDVLVSAHTGSGKTVAFGLALARTLLGDAERFAAAGAPRALIVTPTRELALQVHRELAWLYAETGARITTCVGGMDPRRESHALGHGVHVVVGTPGRLCDHLARGSLVLDRLAAVVLDEADEMLDMGFREDLERLLDAAPRERRTLLFSATIPPPIAQLARRYQRDALRIAASGESSRHRDIEYQVVPIVPRERDLAVVNLLRYHDAPGALVFCATRDGVTHLAANLSERGFSVAALSGELSQRERNQALQALRDGRARVCVATDVAARGLDLPDLGLVIHADLPQNKEVLVHRSGRTGRAGKKGLAILIAPDPARRFVERLLASAHLEASWRLAPSSDDIRDRDQAHLAGEVGALTEDLADADRAVARALLAERSAEDLVAALVRVRREARPAPEELTVPVSMRPRPAAARPTPAPRDRREPSASTRRKSSTRHEPSTRGEPSTLTHREPSTSTRHEPSASTHREPSTRHEPSASTHREPSASTRRESPGPRSVQRSPDAVPVLGEQTVPPRERGLREHHAAPLAPAAGPRHREHAHAADPPLHEPAQVDAPAHADAAAGAAPSARAEAMTADAPARLERSRYVAASRAPWPVRAQRSSEPPRLVWFTINIGRSKNADPKWLVPLLCRRGGISKNAIGKIQILARETRVEISHDVSERFAAAVREPDAKDRNIHIEPLDAVAI
ncbi:MAG TPA: DEAD/DEAH box helicase [Kofleriaceae bacterium]|nr:DEAD/DEAH box helicase [Kofleriaceae bacterium]